MRLRHSLIAIPALALLAMGCAPHHHPHGPKMRMMHGCGPESCTYKSTCFSSGAVRSNDGVCQACSGGKWVATSGCSDHGGCDHHDCKGGHGKCCDHHHGKKGGKSGPCPHAHGAKGQR